MPPFIEPAMPPAPDTTLTGHRARIAAAAAGVRFVSETDAPFAAIAVPSLATGAVTADEVRRLFGVEASAPLREHSLDEFFSYGTAPDPADAASVAAAPRVAALRDLLRALAPDARAWRIGDGPEVRYLVVGRVAGGIAGVETTGAET